MRIAILASAAAIALSGTAMAQQATNMPSINVGTAKIEGNKITGVEVTMDKPGYLVIHNKGAGAPPASLGHIAVGAGKSTNITVESDKPLDPKTEISLMLHYETNGNTTYDFGPGKTDVDVPVTANKEVMSMPMPKM
jgi:hypothetical protein